MPETFYSSSLDNPVAPALPAVQIHRNGTHPNAATDTRVGPAFAIREFVNDEKNSRAAVDVAPGNWKVDWTADFPATFGPMALLTEGTRIAIQGRAGWRLLAMGGQNLAEGPLGPGNVVLDPEHGRMYLPSPESRVMARSLTDGRPALLLAGYFGESFSRDFLAPRGTGIVLVSIQRMMRSKSPVKPDLTVIERYDFGSPMELGLKNVVKSATRRANLLRQTTDFKAAMHGDTLAMAVPNAVYLADSDLRIQSEATGDFEPLSMSLDETLNVYLWVKTANEVALWSVTRKGELRFAHSLRPGETALRTPPIVGYNHNVYLLTSSRIICLGPDGASLWEHSAVASGAVVTPSAQLVSAEGTDVVLYDAAGERTVLHTVERGPMTAAPLIVPNGIIVATRDRCYSLHLEH